MSESLEGMTEPELREVMRRAAVAVEGRLPPGTLFVVLAFGDPKVAQYVSNAVRADIIEALRECADRLRSREDVTR